MKRNEKCKCGSKKKYKNCCWFKDQEELSRKLHPLPQCNVCGSTSIFATTTYEQKVIRFCINCFEKHISKEVELNEK